MSLLKGKVRDEDGEWDYGWEDQITDHSATRIGIVDARWKMMAINILGGYWAGCNLTSQGLMALLEQQVGVETAA